MGVLVRAPGWLLAIASEVRRADVVHVRCPAHISLVALLYVMARRPRGPIWCKYAGNWRPGPEEPASYAFQRWLLRRRLLGGIVTVNGRWPDEPTHVHPMLNPCLGSDEIAAAAAAAAAKRWSTPFRMVFAGRVDAAKGAGDVVQVLRGLKGDGFAAELDLAGDGPDRAGLEAANA